MTRTLISLSDRDKRWLDLYSRRRGQSAAQTVREALHRLRAADADQERAALLAETSGIWGQRHGSSDQYIDQIRNEW